VDEQREVQFHWLHCATKTAEESKITAYTFVSTSYPTGIPLLNLNLGSYRFHCHACSRFLANRVGCWPRPMPLRGGFGDAP